MWKYYTDITIFPTLAQSDDWLMALSGKGEYTFFNKIRGCQQYPLSEGYWGICEALGSAALPCKECRLAVGGQRDSYRFNVSMS